LESRRRPILVSDIFKRAMAWIGMSVKQVGQAWAVYECTFETSINCCDDVAYEIDELDDMDDN
jgi:hypothetical protein